MARRPGPRRDRPAAPATAPPPPAGAARTTRRSRARTCRSTGAGPGGRPGSLVPVAGVDDAEPVAIGIGQDDEVRILGVEVPVDPLGAQRHKPLDLRGLFRRVGCVEVDMNPRMLLRGRGTELQAQPGTEAAGGGQRALVRFGAAFAQLVAERLAPEADGPPHVGHAEYHHANAHHGPILATRPLP